jgi:ribosome biogenesis GTPase
MKGTIVKATGSQYEVLDETGETVTCTIRGQLRLTSFEATNPVVVGDKVEIEREDSGTKGVITALLDRKNYILRKSVKLSKQRHIIAANMDKAYVIATLVLPRTSTGFIDRFLATAEAYSISAGVIFNKVDLYGEEEKIYAEELKSMYEKIGYSCAIISALNCGDIQSLQELLKGKVNLFSGHSGVGKSTIINALIPELHLKTGEISEYHHKGTHTTTFAEMHRLPRGGFIIDTPGIREFGIIDFDRNEVSHFFPEIFRIGRNCTFNNCLHVNEKTCAVIDAVEKGEIALSRYESYLSIFYNEDSFR